MIKLCVFDLDGTLTDSLASLWYCGNKALKDHGMMELPKELYKTMVGDGAAALTYRMIENANGDTGKHEEVFATYKAYFKENYMYELNPYQGIPEMIKELKERGVRMAVLSNKPHVQTEQIIHKVFGNDTFDVIFGQREGVAKKPSPDGVFEILKELQIEQKDVLYLGDTNTDMKTGKAAGVKTIGVLWGFREEKELWDNGADAVISHPLQLIEHLKCPL